MMPYGKGLQIYDVYKNRKDINKTTHNNIKKTILNVKFSCI